MFGGLAPGAGADDAPGTDDTDEGDDVDDEEGDALEWLLHDAATSAVATTTMPIPRRRRRVLREPSVTTTTLRTGWRAGRATGGTQRAAPGPAHAAVPLPARDDPGAQEHDAGAVRLHRRPTASTAAARTSVCARGRSAATHSANCA